MVFIREDDKALAGLSEAGAQWDRGFDAGYAAAKAEAWIEKARAWDEGYGAAKLGEFETDNPWRKTHE